MHNPSDSSMAPQKDEDSASLSTNDFILSLNPTSENKFYPLKGCKGFNIQVTPAGTKIYVLRYRFKAKQKIYTLGTYPGLKPKDALAAAQIVIGDIAKKIDPNEVKAQDRRKAKEASEPKYKVKDLAADFLKNYVEKELQESSIYEIRRYLDEFIIPAIGTLDVKEVQAAHINKIVNDEDENPVQANRIRSAASGMFNWAILDDKRDLGTNPVAVVKKKTTNGPREARLCEAEVVRVGKTLKEIDEIEMAKYAILLYLLTGMRKSELIGDKSRKKEPLTWDRVNLETGILMVHTKARKKAKQFRPVYCSKAVITLLKSIPKTDGNPYVITGRLKGSSLVGIQDIWERVRVAAGLEPDVSDEDGDRTIHDLRRTYASIAMDMGYKTWVPTLLGHKVKNVTDIYTRSEIAQVMKVAEAIGRRIDGLLRGTVRPL